jgi:hypothetical protein
LGHNPSKHVWADLILVWMQGQVKERGGARPQAAMAGQLSAQMENMTLPALCDTNQMTIFY